MVNRAQPRKTLPFSERGAFERSDVWQRILTLSDDMLTDLVEKCLDNTSSLEEIRYAQGGVDAIKWFREVLNLVFEESEDGSNT